MARRPRVVIPAVPHHVTQRGNNRADVFFSDQDRIRYIHMLRQHSLRHDVRILGWCLMTNHVHLILIPATEKSLALTLGQTHSQYSSEQNRSRGRVGHIWQNRFYSCPLATSHLLTAMQYVDLNPIRAGLTANACDWRWSSAAAHASPQSRDELLDHRWIAWMEEARLGEWDHAQWKDGLAAVALAEKWNDLRRATRVGEPLGSKAFVSALEAQAGRRLRVRAQGRPPAAEKTVAMAG